MRCPECGEQNEADVARCFRCGASLSSLTDGSHGEVRRTELDTDSGQGGSAEGPAQAGGPARAGHGGSAVPVRRTELDEAPGGGTPALSSPAVPVGASRRTQLDDGPVGGAPAGSNPFSNWPSGGSTPPSVAPGRGGNMSRTQLDEANPGAPGGSAAPAAANLPRVVGWMVSFNFNPSGDAHPVRAGRTTIGRGRGNDISLFFDGRTSEHHATIIFRRGKCAVKDEGSTNGVLLNGEDIGIGATEALSSGDVITVGDSSYKLFLLDDAEVARIWPNLASK